MKTLLKRIPTNTAGVFYKEIVSKNNKIIDKVFLIRYTDANNKQRLKTIGKNLMGLQRLIVKQKSKLTFDDLANKYFEDKAYTTKET